MADIQAMFSKLLRYANNLSEYERAMQEGIIDENTFVIVLDEKVAKFKGETFDWSGSGVIDTSTLATKEELENLTAEVIRNEKVQASALVDLDARINEIITILNNAGL
jgi:hypothetical protein